MRKRAKLDFERRGGLTAIDDAAFARILPVIRQYMPRIHLSMSERQIRAHIDAILYLSIFYCPWRKIKNYRSIYRFYRRLLRRGALTLLQVKLGRSTPLEIIRPRKEESPASPPSRKRKCPPCPKCKRDAMVCYHTKKKYDDNEEIRMVVRYSKCSECGHTSVFIETRNNRWWNNPSSAHFVPTCC